jgi:hypothetical protein
MAVDRGQRNYLLVETNCIAAWSMAVNKADFFGALPARSCRKADWAKERKLWMLPLISFETGRRSQTQSPVQHYSLV